MTCLEIKPIIINNTFFTFKMQLSVITTIDKRISLIESLSLSHSFLITGNKQSSEGPKKTVVQSFLLNMLSFYSWADNF